MPGAALSVLLALSPALISTTRGGQGGPFYPQVWGLPQVPSW